MRASVRAALRAAAFSACSRTEARIASLKPFPAFSASRAAVRDAYRSAAWLAACRAARLLGLRPPRESQANRPALFAPPQAVFAPRPRPRPVALTPSQTSRPPARAPRPTVSIGCRAAYFNASPLFLAPLAM
ncbi:hypothetical protein GCM10009635_32710 [Actinocatenispora thailandica]